MENKIESQLNEIIKRFTLMEKKGKENEAKYITWIIQISDPKVKLISNLIEYFQDELTNQEIRENIIKVLIKLLQLKRDIVKPQLLEIESFPSAISNYIIKSDKTKLSQNAFLLITEVFIEETFKTIINEDFIKALYNGIAIIQEEEILQEIVCVLIEINSKYEDGIENLVLKVHHTNDHSRLLDELLLRIFNIEKDINKQFKIILLINRLMDYENSPLFYHSDIEIFIDIILSKLQSTDLDHLKVFLFSSLEKLLKYDSYYQSCYKLEEIGDLIDEFKNHDDESSSVKELCAKIIKNMDSHMKNK